MEETRKNRQRTRPGAFAAAAAVVLIAAGGIVLATRGTETKPRPRGSVIQPGSASCVEQYSLDTLKRRAIAFAGTVESVSDDEVTLTVDEWFKGGGSSTRVTLKGASTLGGITSAGPSVSLDPGSRLLVAGDGGFAWACGFTQPYSQQVADDWRRALR